MSIIKRNLLLGVALAFAGTLAFTAGAYAGQCPPDKMRADATKPAPHAHAPKGVTDTVLSSIDLGAEKVALKGYQFRLRRLVIQPGGIVPWHSHAERPAQIYVVSGQILEYASTCAVPIVHKAGEVAPETHATAHWWQNTGTVPVVLISVDINKDPNDKTM